MDQAILIVAAGRGHRAGGPLPKQWQGIAGKPVARWTLEAFARRGRLVLVVHPDDRALARSACDGIAVTLVDGGASRTASVRAGLEALADDPPATVLIHDVARPCVPSAVIDAVSAALATARAAAPALAVTDALWTGNAGRVTGTRDRAGLFRAQTPQGFRFDAILDAHRRFSDDAADDVAVARAAGIPVSIVAGDERNMKITGPADFARATALLESTMDVRVGNGYDVHRFGPGDHVILCGVRVPHDRALLGHSDADVGMHAVTDALYGALAEGDIGRHFPPSDDRWKGAASDMFLCHAAERVRDRGYAIANIDVTLVCERPKIGPHAEAMMRKMTEILRISPGRVSIKATTSERLGFTGREEGIAAMATASLVPA